MRARISQLFLVRSIFMNASTLDAFSFSTRIKQIRDSSFFFFIPFSNVFLVRIFFPSFVHLNGIQILRCKFCIKIRCFCPSLFVEIIIICFILKLCPFFPFQIIGESELSRAASMRMDAPNKTCNNFKYALAFHKIVKC